MSLVDAMLAVLALTLVAVSVPNVVTGWIGRKLSQAEARGLSVWADAAAAWLLDDFDGRNPGAVPDPIDLDAVRAGAALPDWNGGTTPYRRRAIRLWAWEDGPDRVIVAAVATGGEGPFPLPTPGEGIDTVGALANLPGATEVIGAGFVHDLATQIALVALAEPGDMVALRHVAREASSPYLHRERVAGRPELNRMEADLDMAGGGLTGAAVIETAELVTDAIGGSVTVVGDLEVTGGIEAAGTVTAAGAVITGGIEADSIAGAQATVTVLNADTVRTNGLTCTGVMCPEEPGI